VIPGVRAEEPRDVGAARLVEGDADALAQQTVEGRRVEILRLREEARALGRERLEADAEALVELAVRAAPEPGGLLVGAGERVAVERLELAGQLDAGPLEALAAVAVGLVRDRRPEIPEADRCAVDLRLERRLELREAFLLSGRDPPEQTLAREAPELDRAARGARPGGRLPELGAGLGGVRSAYRS
jgi:hypothetical protein